MSAVSEHRRGEREKVARFSRLLVACLGLCVALCAAITIARPQAVFGFPSNKPHDDAKYHTDALISWELNWDEDGDTPHIHRPHFSPEAHILPLTGTGDAFQGATDAASPGPEPFSAYAAWDDRTFRVDDTGVFGNGHGFINEWLCFGGGADKIPRYTFDLNDSWPATQTVTGNDPRSRIRQAFSMWNGVGSHSPGYVTGLQFQEVDSGGAEIVVHFQDTRPLGGGLGVTRAGLRPVEIWFDETPAVDYDEPLASISATAKHTDGGNLAFDPGEFVYWDNTTSGTVSAGDERYTRVGAYAPGSLVAAGDTDVGTALIGFNASEETTKGGIYRDANSNHKIDQNDVRLLSPFVEEGFPHGSTVIRDCWYFGSAEAATPAERYHFTTTAIHEVGHVVGLDEQNDKHDVMYRTQFAGSNVANGGPNFDTLSGTFDSEEGAEDLYTVPIERASPDLLPPDFPEDGCGHCHAWNVSTSASSPWSLALAAVIAILLAALVPTRAPKRHASGPSR